MPQTPPRGNILILFIIIQLFKTTALNGFAFCHDLANLLNKNSKKIHDTPYSSRESNLETTLLSGKKRKKRFLLLWKCAAEKSPGGLAAHVGEKYGGVTALHTDRSIQTQQSCREKDSNDQKERGSQEWRK